MKFINKHLSLYREEYKINLKEGLIKTTPIGKSIGLLKKQYPDFDWVEVERFSVNEKRGGKRESAGAKPKYSEPTKTTAFRIPISKIDEVKEVVNRMLSGYAENNQ